MSEGNAEKPQIIELQYQKRNTPKDTKLSTPNIYKGFNAVSRCVWIHWASPLLYPSKLILGLKDWSTLVRPGAPSSFLLLLVRHLLLLAWHLLLVASLLLVVRPGATSSVLVPSSDAPLFLVASCYY